jgi:two-component system chemotaxis response regulator CheY
MKAIVTDDSRATRLILTKLLTDIGFDVTQAEDGAALFELLNESSPDLCLLDWNMPGMNGTQIIRTLKAHPTWKGIPTVIVTDETQKERVSSALEAGAIAYLPKPFQQDALEAILAEAGFSLE